MSDYFGYEIRFTADSPEKIFHRFTQNGEYTFWGNITEHRCFDENFFKKAKQLTEQLNLEKNLKEIVAFGKGLGTTDLDGQLNHCASNSRLFLERAEAAKQDYCTKGKIYRMLCMLASVGIAIMLL